MKVDANIVLFKCGKAREIYGVRVQKMEDGDWYRTWAFKIKPQAAKREGFDKNTIQANLDCTNDYPGCPHCGAIGFVQCGKCGKISCWNGETSMTCPWCETKMTDIVTATDKFTVDGGRF